MQRIKISIITLLLLLIIPTMQYSVNIKIIDCDFQDLDPTKDLDAKFWHKAMTNILNNAEIINCLPENWQKVGDLREKKLSIMICDKRLDQQEHDTGRKYCAGNLAGGIIFRTIKSYNERPICGCPETSALHELIHKATNVSDDFNDNIDGCIKLAFQCAGICEGNEGPGNPCDCRDEEGNKSPCDTCNKKGKTETVK